MSQTNLMFKEIHFDSDEEVFMAMWLEELKEKGYIACWKKIIEPIPLTKRYKIEYTKSTQLKTKIKKEKKEFTLLRPSEYTPDFEIHWTRTGFEKFLYNLIAHKLSTDRREYEQLITDPHKALFFSKEYNETLVEIKPAFDMQNMERGFVHKQKYLWDKLQIFVNLVEPVELFRKTFLPLLAASYFKYKKSPTGKNKGKKGPGDWKMDWIPKTINEYLNN